MRTVNYYEDPPGRKQQALYAFERFGQGCLTAVQFGLAFADGCRELELAGYEKGNAELLYAYLGKISPKHRKETLEDRRDHWDPRGVRSACRWEEARTVLVWLEERDRADQGEKEFLCRMAGARGGGRLEGGNGGRSPTGPDR